MENPRLTGRAGTPGRGAFMVLSLGVENGRISAAKYHTVGCGPTIACGSMLSELVVGQSIEECHELTAEKPVVQLASPSLCSAPDYSFRARFHPTIVGVRDGRVGLQGGRVHDAKGQGFVGRRAVGGAWGRGGGLVHGAGWRRQ